MRATVRVLLLVFIDHYLRHHVKMRKFHFSDVLYRAREAVVLHIQGTMKFKEIARLQQTSVKTALSRYRYGLNKLRSIFNGEVE